MRFHNVLPPEISGYAEPEYGYYAEPTEGYGYFAEDPYLSEDLMYGEVDPNVGYYGEVDPTFAYYGEVDPTVGYYGEAEPAYGYYGEAEPAYGYYGQVEPALGYYGAGPGLGPMGAWGEPDAYGQVEPVGYFAEEFPVGYYGEEVPLAGYGQELPMGYYGEEQPLGYYGQAPEMVGYGEPEPQFAEDYPGMSYYGESEFAEPELSDYGGYVRDMPPAFNAGCPLPTNLSGFGDVDGFGGYSTPATVNPTCDRITPQPGTAPSPPETFKPLW